MNTFIVENPKCPEWLIGETKAESAPTRKGVRPAKQPVEQYTLDHVLVDTYNSIRRAAKAANTDKSTFARIVSGQHAAKTAGGFIWKYAAQSQG